MKKKSSIKLNADFFNNEKIKIIKCLPEGSSIILFWIELIFFAKSNNSNGLLRLSSNIPISIESLATIMQISIEKIKIYINILLKYRLLVYSDEYLTLTNYDELWK